MAAESAASPAQAAPKLLMVRLSIMMFLQWAMFGLWVPVAGRFLRAGVVDGGLGFSDAQVGWIIGISGSIGALLAPFLGGQLADRYFSTERIMAVFLVIGGVLRWLTAYQTTFGAWLVLSIGSAVVAAPTIALSNSLAFAHMSDPSRQFPKVRVWGTLGWIVPAWVFPMVWLQTGLHLTWKPPFLVGSQLADATHLLIDSFKVSGVLAIVYALYCLTLPNTPPKRGATKRLAVGKAFGLFRKRSFLVLVAATLLIAGIHNIYFIQTPQFLPGLGLRDADIMPAMSLGQIAEIFVIASLGLLLKRLGFRTVLTLGGVGYVLRFAVAGTTALPLWAMVASQAFHGVCFGCFYAAAFIYVDRIAEADVRHSAQTIYAILLGAGPVLGGWLNGFLAKHFTPPGGTLNYAGFWYTAAAIGLVATVVLAVLFRDEGKQAEGTEGSTES